MAIRKRIWIYPDANPSITNSTTISNVSNTVSNSTTLDYFTVNFNIAGTAAGNGYLYANMPLSSYTIQAGDYLEYCIYLPNITGQQSFGVDIFFTNGVLRDAGQFDQNGINAHPATDLTAQAGQKWYYRKIPITTGTGGSTIGTSITNIQPTCENETIGTSVARFKNIAITDGKGTGVYETKNFINFTGSN
jgi:hypothetical protein